MLCANPKCGTPFVPKRSTAKYCADRCKDAVTNARRLDAKKKARSATLRKNGGRCYVSGCDWQSRKGRMYVVPIKWRDERLEYSSKGDCRVLCGYHFAALFRPDASGEVIPRVGAYYHGYLHVSIEAAELEIDKNGNAIHTDDGGINQLLDHLSGELDADGAPIPHPLLESRREHTMYTNPSSNWTPSN